MSVLKDLKAERRKLDRAIAILEGVKQHRGTKRGSKGRRKLSAAARKAISLAQRKRWALKKKEEAKTKAA